VPISILIADDHEVVRHGLRTLLELDPELVVVGEASDGAEAVDVARQTAPDVVLMDLVMPGTDGITATQRIRSDLPASEVVALTSVLESASAVSAVQAGAIAFLLKDTRADELRRRIRAAAAGQVQFSPRLVERLLRDVPAPQPVTALSSTEIALLCRPAAGDTNAQMAQALGVDEAKLRAAVNAVLAKLGVYSRTHAALYALQIGLDGADGRSGHPLDEGRSSDAVRGDPQRGRRLKRRPPARSSFRQK
jgi:DNA-binding NarL/FixJ family response regulator